MVYDEERGYSPYHPLLMVKLLLYGYATGVRSKRHLAALSDLFTPVLLLCKEAGLVKLGYVAIDGTKVRFSRTPIAEIVRDDR